MLRELVSRLPPRDGIGGRDGAPGTVMLALAPCTGCKGPHEQAAGSIFLTKEFKFIAELSGRAARLPVKGVGLAG